MSWKFIHVVFACLIFLALLGISNLIGDWLGASRLESFYVALVLSIPGIVLLVFADRWLKSDEPSADVQARIAVLQLKKYALHSEQTENLSTRDISSLRIYKIIVISIVSSIGFIIMTSTAIMSTTDHTRLIIAGTAFLIFLAIGLGINKRMNRTIASGKKTIARGIVTKKDTSVGETRDKPHHWLYVGDRKIKVENIIYVTYHVGNAAEFHLFDYFGTVVLHHEKLENAGIEGE